ncbi:NAD(+) diphosphatase [Agilicoccus flavus]|uniref:NAD(+) diphosphatase n=1 Tax=Agilicoccus flavus TaxID=2775968 RepID=UPI001CF6EA96|nr:NAD(+) diphosphatase [Agilicoccus flavus]
MADPRSPRPAPGPLDRRGVERDDPDLLPRLLAEPGTRVVELSGGRAPVVESGGEVRVVDRAPAPGDEEALAFFLGRESTDTSGAAHVVVVLPAGPDGQDPTGSEVTQEVTWQGIRDVGAALADGDLDRLMTGVALANWHASHPHCPRCGARTHPVNAGWVRRCEADGSDHFPRSDPAVIMAVLDPDDRLLLARNPAWPAGRRSVLAGFVEPGERLEEAVAREVAEEVGIVVGDVAYAGSQPWPFPASLMLGFTARATTGEIVCDPAEIAEADWFTREELATAVADGSLGLPGRTSIARRLVEGWYGTRIVPPAEVSFHRPD